MEGVTCPECEESMIEVADDIMKAWSQLKVSSFPVIASMMNNSADYYLNSDRSR